MLIEKIKNPQDLKELSIAELKELAKELREVIIETVATNGGHLASNLGSVDLTIALHYIFNSPTDKIIWDVGHQAYAHKLLTGRANAFSTIRKHAGISGFPKMTESPHDAFGTGHSSTSISSALGIIEGRDQNKEKFKVIAVIGDGALTAGLAFEGLNHAGHLKKDLIVILNECRRPFRLSQKINDGGFIYKIQKGNKTVFRTYSRGWRACSQNSTKS
jgi:1-deoxy-D-xylulose-5-phosphate synthase